MPRVAIQICTYSRPKEIRLCINALRRHLKYDDLFWLVCDDSTGGSYLRDLKDEFPFLTCLSTPDRSGWGINVNEGLRYIYTILGIDYVYFTEDDYILSREIDLTSGLHLLTNSGVGLLRYDGLAGHRLDLTLEEFPYSGHREGLGWDKITYLRLLRSSQNLNIYSNRPHLKHRRFHDHYGLYPEGLTLGMTETSFAHIVRDRMTEDGAPQIAALPEFILRYYDDIGVSFQLTPQDQETVQL